jgi:hypothetical protein
MLTRKTGISGWFPVLKPALGWDGNKNQPENEADDISGRRESELAAKAATGEKSAAYRLERVVGGLEVELKFGRAEDLERVVRAARGVGWAPEYDIEHRDWDSAGEDRGKLKVLGERARGAGGTGGTGPSTTSNTGTGVDCVSIVCNPNLTLSKYVFILFYLAVYFQ